MSVRQNWGVGPIIAFVLLLVIAASVFMILPNMLRETTTLHLGDGIFRARVISNVGDIGRGLFGEAYFDPDEALIIVFPSDDKWDIGTKDIKAPIDIVWLNSDKKVVYIVKRASPENLTSSVFSPKTSARYIIELPAGTVDGKAINIDYKATFQLNAETGV